MKSAIITTMIFLFLNCYVNTQRIKNLEKDIKTIKDEQRWEEIKSHIF